MNTLIIIKTKYSLILKNFFKNFQVVFMINYLSYLYNVKYFI